MTESTPPFAALRALEAATRHRSFTWAARELKITHSAVSQAVRRLEAELGTRLFERRGGAMEPSEAARRLAESYSAAAQQLQTIIRDITGDELAPRLTVTMPPDLAGLWFSGRGGRLKEAMPDLEVVVSADAAPGATPDVQLIVTPKLKPQDQALAEVTLAPVCAPGVREGEGVATPEALLAAPLLTDGSDAWQAWLGKYAPGRRVRPVELESAEAALAAAARGEGVAIVQLLAAQPFLASGELALLPFPAPSGRTLALRSRAVPAKEEAVERLTMWLKLELARDAAQMRKLPQVRGEAPRRRP